MPSSAPAGWHYASSENGALSIEEDAPSPGVATITWSPSYDFDGAKKRVEFFVPMDVLEKVAVSFAKAPRREQPAEATA